MQNYERMLVLEDICEESSPIEFVVILGAFYSSSQKHDKYICYLHLNIIINENKEGKKKRTEERAVLLQWHMLVKDRAILTRFSDLHLLVQ